MLPVSLHDYELLMFMKSLGKVGKVLDFMEHNLFMYSTHFNKYVHGCRLKPLLTGHVVCYMYMYLALGTGTVSLATRIMIYMLEKHSRTV